MFNFYCKRGNPGYIILLLFLLFFSQGFEKQLLSNGLFTNTSSGPQLFDLDDFGGALSLQYQMTGLKMLYDGVLDFERRSDYFELGLNLNAKGSIYHPNLVYFDIDLNLVGFTQKEKNLYFSDSAINNSINNNYNIRINFLRQKKINFQFYALKYFYSYHRRQEERNFTNSTETGFSLYGNTKLFPFNLILSKIRTRYETLANVNRNELINNIKLSVNLIPNKDLRSFFKFNNKDYSESVYGTKYNSTQAQADFFLPYGYGMKSQFSARAFYNKMSGDFNYENIRFGLGSRHFLKKNLSIKSDIGLDVNSNTGRTLFRNSFRSFLEHRLFESLLTSVGGEAEIVKSDNQDYNIYGIGSIINYTKIIPNGLISVSYLKMFNKGDYFSKGDIADRSEIYDFSFSDLIILNMTGVKIGSIRLTDPELGFLYLEGFDYTLDMDDSQVIITRIPGGSITAGSKVRVSYQFLSYPDFSMRNSPYQLNCSLNFLKYFSVFYKNTASLYKVSSDFMIPPFVDSEVDSYGFRVSSDLVGGEYSYEKNENSSNIYYSKNYRASLNLKLKSYIRLGFHMTGNDIEYEGGSLTTQFRSKIAEINIIPSHQFNFRAYYRKLDYSNQNSNWFRESFILKLQWNLRKIIFEMFYEKFLNLSGLSDRTNDYFVARIRRLF